MKVLGKNVRPRGGLTMGFWAEDFSDPKKFRENVLIGRKREVRGLPEEERKRLIALSDEELEEEMDRNLDLTEFFMQ